MPNLDRLNTEEVIEVLIRTMLEDDLAQQLADDEDLSELDTSADYRVERVAVYEDDHETEIETYLVQGDIAGYIHIRLDGTSKAGLAQILKLGYEATKFHLGELSAHTPELDTPIPPPPPRPARIAYGIYATPLDKFKGQTLQAVIDQLANWNIGKAATPYLESRGMTPTPLPMDYVITGAPEERIEIHRRMVEKGSASS